MSAGRELPRIFIDADSCAKKARNYALELAAKKEIRIELIANRSLSLPFESPVFTVRISGTKKDASDNLILNEAGKGDIVVTRDYLLAERLLGNGVYAINDKGTVFTAESIKTYIEERNLSLNLKQLGAVPKGKWDSYSRDDLQGFKKSLSRVLQM